MRLCIITQTVDRTDPVLGFFHAWIAAFAARCEQVIVVCLREGEHCLPANVRVLSLGKEEHMPPLPPVGGRGWHVCTRTRLSYLARFYRYLWRERHAYDTVLVHMNPEYVVLGAPLWRVLGKRVALWYTHKAVTVWLRVAVHLAHIIFTASKESFRIPSAKVRVVGHGIDVDMFAYHPSLPLPLVRGGGLDVVPPPLSRGSVGGAVRLVCVGRISRTKRQDLVLEALALVCAQGMDMNLVVVGAPLTDADRAYERKLRARTHELGLTDVVRWEGGVPHGDLPRYLLAADLFVHTSETGSLDKVVLEALAAGCALVTTSEAVRDALPLELRRASYADATPEALAALIVAGGADGIERARYRDLGRAFVSAQHALPGLVARIIDALEA